MRSWRPAVQGTASTEYATTVTQYPALKNANSALSIQQDADDASESPAPPYRRVRPSSWSRPPPSAAPQPAARLRSGHNFENRSHASHGDTVLVPEPDDAFFSSTVHQEYQGPTSDFEWAAPPAPLRRSHTQPLRVVPPPSSPLPAVRYCALTVKDIDTVISPSSNSVLAMLRSESSNSPTRMSPFPETFTNAAKADVVVMQVRDPSCPSTEPARPLSPLELPPSPISAQPVAANAYSGDLRALDAASEQLNAFIIHNSPVREPSRHSFHVMFSKTQGYPWQHHSDGMDEGVQDHLLRAQEQPFAIHSVFHEQECFGY